MAADGNVTQVIDLKLQTDWDAVLKRDLTKYNNFVAQIGDEQRNIEKSFNSMARSISDNMTSMFSGAAKSVFKGMQQGRTMFRDMMTQGLQANELYLKSFDKLNAAASKYEKQVSDLRKKLTSQAHKEIILEGADPEKAKAKAQAALSEVEEEVARKLKSIQDKIDDEFVRRLGRAASTASKNIAKITNTNLKAVEGTAKGAIKEFYKMHQSMASIKNASDLYDYKTQFKEMESQHSNLQRTLRRQAKATADAEKQMYVARSALLKSQNEETRNLNLKAFRDTLVNLNKSKSAYKELEQEVYAYGKSIDIAKDKINQMANALKKSISQQTRSSNIQNQEWFLGSKTQDAVNNLVKQARIAGKGFSDAFGKSAAKSKEFEMYMQGNIEKLKKLRSEAVTLKNTGFVDTSKEIANIDRVLGRYQSFWNEYKKQQKLIQDFSKTKGSTPVLNLTDLNKVRSSYKNLMNDVKSFGKVNAENISQVNSKVKQLSGVWNGYLGKRKEVAKNIQSIQSKMHEVELMMSKTTNKEMLADLNAFYKQLVSRVNSAKKSLGKIDDSPVKIKLEIESVAGKIKKDIEKGIRSTNINRINIDKQMGNAVNDMVAQFKLMGKGATDALKESINKTKTFERAIESDTVKLREFRRQAVELKNTGLVDTTQEIRNIDRILNKYESFWREYKQQQQLMQNLSKRSAPITGVGDLNKAKRAYQEVANEVRKLGKVNEENLFEAQDKIRKLNTLWEKYVAKRKEVNGKIKKIQSEMHDVEIMMQRSTNAALTKELEKYYAQLKSKLNAVKNSLAQISKPPAELKSTFVSIKRQAEDIQLSVQKLYRYNLNYANQTFSRLTNGFKEVNLQAQKLEKKRFINTSSIKAAQVAITKLNEDFEKYRKRIDDVRREYQRLEQLQRKGLGNANIQKQISDLKKLESQMKSYARTIRDESVKAQKSLNNLQNKATKSTLRSSWEAIRNFRWQVAAVIYLISRAVMALQRTVFQVFNNIQKFRMDTMSLAASFSMQMIGNIRENYSRAVSFARDLYVKLEMQAAKTILTMEDMMMLTKTFAQAGVIPKTDKDVERIATIGTAIKALTEGMANAGVQMRQELYAIIAGRQRATDQLAMMFKFIGINIQKVIKDAKEEGTSMIEALSDALEPFNEMNRVMESEYSAVINRLKVIWGVIQRIGAEHILIDTAKQLLNFANSLYSETENGTYALTELGRKLAMTLGASLEIVKALAATLLDMGKMIVTVWGGHAQIMLNLFMGMNDKSKDLKGVWKAIAAIFEASMYSMAIMRTYIQGMTILFTTQLGVISNIAQLIDGIVTNLAGWATADWGKINLGGVKIKQGLIGVKNTIIEAKDNVKKLPEIFNETKKAIDDVYKALDEVVKKQTELGDLLEIPHPGMGMGSELSKLNTKYNELRKAASDSREKIQVQYEIDIEGLEDTKRKLIENIKASNDALQKIASAGIGRNSGSEKVIRLRLEAFYEYLNKIDDVMAMAEAKRLKALQDLTDKEIKAMAQARRQWETFINSIRDKPDTRREKTEKWYRQQVERVEELVKTNKLGANRIDEAWAALSAGYADRMKQDTKAIREEIDGLMESLKSHDVINAYDKLDQEFQKIYDKIDKMADIDEVRKFQLKEQVYLVKQQRIEMQKIEDMLRNRSKSWDIMSQQGKLMQMDYSPIKQQMGEIKELHATTEKALDDIAAEMIKIQKQNQKEPGIWNKNSQAAQEYFDLLKEQYRLTQEVFEKELWAKQHPLWNDLNEMSKSWGDNIADILTDAILDFEDFADNIQDIMKGLWTQIAKDFINASIKRKVIEPMMDQMGGFGDSENPTLLEKWFGATAKKGVEGVTKGAEERMKEMSKLDQMLSNGEPIPVTIVTSETMTAQFNSIKESSDELNDSVEKQTDELKNANDKVKDAVDNGFQINKNALMQIASAIMSGNFSEAAEGAGNLVSGIISAVGSYYGGGMNTGAPAHIGAGQTTAFGMAEGGTIKEHIVGKGLSSGQIYQFGEKSKYGEYEDVVPRSKIRKTETRNNIHVTMPINLNALDTRTGVEFITRNQRVIENNMTRSMKNNRAIRRIMNNGR